ncbi:hypothetical protein PUN28_012182 [Cardiocondyla obscurior]|uniref:Cell cycle checkpoint protein RAD17 n=1 Tax=Cardiocondyla obscurior TaxID=286306 RepID=A0AAW2FEW6_9HYME
MVEKKKSEFRWCISSFDSDFESKPQSKRAKTTELDTTEFDTLFKQSDFKRSKTETSLSSLLQACEPQNKNHLAISKQKQNEISKWLQCKSLKKQPSMLVLSGPSGCGKTVAVKLLAKENNFDVIEWITPVDPAEDENGFRSRQGDRFEAHMIRATRYHSVLSNCSKQLFLVKDIPNVYLENSKSFIPLLEKYFQMGKVPVIFICTETGSSSLAHTLFPPEIREKFGIDHINTCAATDNAMKNVLTRVSNTLNSLASNVLNVSQRHIDEILSNSIGDVRSAVLNLIFISLKVSREQQFKSECGVREETLSLLHAVGRVINPKRVTTSNDGFVHDPEELAAFFQFQSKTFVQFLQENYLRTIRTIEEAAVASGILSLADVLNSEWRDYNLCKFTLSYSIRGLMLANEKPIKNWNPIKKPQNDHSNIRKCLAKAETQYYEKIIKPTLNETNKMNENEETIIEED